MPEPSEHFQSRGWIESFLRYIPGFRGYLEKEYRRESDQLQRNWLAERIQRSKPALDTYAQELVEAVDLDSMPIVDRLRSKLDKSIGKIQGAVQGYSGFFDLVQITEADLDRVYEHDIAMMEEVEKFCSSIEALPGSGQDAKTALNSVIQQVDAFDQKWNTREDILKGLK